MLFNSGHWPSYTLAFINGFFEKREQKIKLSWIHINDDSLYLKGKKKNRNLFSGTYYKKLLGKINEFLCKNLSGANISYHLAANAEFKY